MKYAAMLLGIWLAGLALFTADAYEHAHQPGVVNMRGYRGPIRPFSSGYTNIAVLGGSTAYGYGVRANEAWPAQLETMLGPHVRVYNFAYNNEGAYSFAFTLRDYASLKPDLVILESGYNDLGKNFSVYRHTSAIFRWTGYMPVLPLVLREKALLWRSNGQLDDAYRGKVVFRPSFRARTLETLAGMLEVGNRPSNSEGEPSSSVPPNETYCEQIDLAISLARDNGAKVLLVRQPIIGPQHAEQQRALAFCLGWKRPPDWASWAVIERIDLHDPAMALDGMHLTAQGNAFVAAQLREPVERLIGGR